MSCTACGQRGHLRALAVYRAIKTQGHNTTQVFWSWAVAHGQRSTTAVRWARSVRIRHLVLPTEIMAPFLDANLKDSAPAEPHRRGRAQRGRTGHRLRKQEPNTCAACAWPSAARRLIHRGPHRLSGSLMPKLSSPPPPPAQRQFDEYVPIRPSRVPYAPARSNPGYDLNDWSQWPLTINASIGPS